MKLRDEFERIVNPDNAQTASKVTPLQKVTKLYSDSQSVIIDSIDNCEVKYAKCCSPIPGDTIIGFITKGHGVSIHKYDCPNAVAGMNDPHQADRWIVASWNDRAVSPEKHIGNYDAVLMIYASFNQTLLADITLALTDMNVSVSSVSVHRKGDGCLVEAVIKCSNVEHLKSIISGLKRLKYVTEIVRGG